MKVILLVGLPGSGKTTFARNLYGPRGYVILDDPRDPKEVEDALLRASNAPGVVIADPHLVRRSTRACAARVLQGHDVEWVFFENNPDAAEANVLRRTDGRRVDVRAFSQMYDVPEGVVVKPIWRPIGA